MSGDVQHSKPVRLASAALYAFMEDKDRSAVVYVQRIGDECGGEGLEVAIRGWIDTMVDHAADGHPISGIGATSFAEAETGTLRDATSDELPEAVRWAGKLIAARATLDLDGYTEALAELPHDPAEIGAYVWSLLNIVATTIRNMPRGYALMGRP